MILGGGRDGVEVFIVAFDDPLVGEEGLELFDMFWVWLSFREMGEPVRSAFIWLDKTLTWFTDVLRRFINVVRRRVNVLNP